MTCRSAQIRAFLADAGWETAKRTAFAGDASNRRYERLLRTRDGARAFLMDAAPSSGENVDAFVRIAKHLQAIGLSPPTILAQDIRHGLLLLEDLGDALFAAEIRKTPSREKELYLAAVGVLAEVHKHAAPTWIPAYTPDVMARCIAPVFDWYLAESSGAISQEKEACTAELETVLQNSPVTNPVLVLRDYHAENLLWLPDRHGVKRVGILDFQDAVRGHPVYDLVSLLEDARRDVGEPTRSAAIRRFAALTGQKEADILKEMAAQGAQRNLRILGVFARLCIKSGRPAYVGLLPRVWHHLMRDLSHPALADLRQIVMRTLPAPTPETIKRLKARCPEHRNP